MTTLGASTLAGALLSVAKDRFEPETVARELAEVARILTSVPLLKRTLSDPGIPSEERHLIVSDVLGNLLSPVTLGFLDVLIDENQVGSVDAVAEIYRRFLDEDQAVIRAHVTSAIELAPDDVSALREGLADKLGGHVVIEQEVDPSILGGLIVRVGDTVFDGSIAGRLRRLREELDAPPRGRELGAPSDTATAGGDATSPGTGTASMAEDSTGPRVRRGPLTPLED